MRTCLIAFAGLSLIGATATAPFEITPEVQSALKQIQPSSLRGNLSFIASDLLAGRDTPSPGLEIAAEYIAAQFRKSDVEPGGDDGYFQTVHLMQLEPDLSGVSLRFNAGENTAAVKPEEVSVRNTSALDLEQTPLFKVDTSDADQASKLTAE
ncbi:MAG: hypothetical protein JO022_16995, partial [Acidobacteriaceae bacterium]|nr:hypothetical protein [Acidobacteriaceae bacterium]